MMIVYFLITGIILSVSVYLVDRSYTAVSNFTTKDKVPVSCKVQNHLGDTEAKIRKKYPTKTFKVEYSDDGYRYITTDFEYGIVSFLFSKDTGIVIVCAQVPYNDTALNILINYYNIRYKIISKNAWEERVSDGKIIIELKNDVDYNRLDFHYRFIK